MHYSFSTVLMTILASNLLIILITFCFRKEKLMLSIGYKLLAVFLILTLIRFLLPFEWTFTRTIALPEFPSKIITHLRHVFFEIGLLKISLWFIFECIWLIGSIFFLYQHIKSRYKSVRYIAAHGHDITEQEPIRTILSDICGKRKNPFRVTIVQNVDIPQIFGIFSPRILIPDYVDINCEDFRFILQHETYHYFHHDMLIKEAVNLLCILYWWNPACKLFKEQVGLILEMHVDDSLVNKDTTIGVAYMRSLIHILEAASDKRNYNHTAQTIAMVSTKEEELTQRFQMLCRKNRMTRIPIFILLLTIVLFIYLCSYGIIFEARYNNRIENSEEIFDNVTGFYAVPKEDGTYDLYLNGIFTENVENLDYYSNTPVLPAN